METIAFIATDIVALATVFSILRPLDEAIQSITSTVINLMIYVLLIFILFK